MKRTLEIMTLVRYLQDCAAANKIATFEEMSERLGGMDIRSKYRYILSAALSKLRIEHSKVFVSVLGVGYKSLSNEGIAKQVTAKCQGKIVRQTERWDSGLRAVQPHRLSGSALKEYIQCEFKLAGQKLINDCKTQARLESRAEKSTRCTGLEFAREAAIALADVS